MSVHSVDSFDSYDSEDVRGFEETRNAIYGATISRESSATDPNPIKLTDYAIKYGERTNLAATKAEVYDIPVQHFLVGVDSPAGHSGLTPSTLFTTPNAFPRSKKEYELYAELSAYQRRHLEGFTASELRDLFAVENPDATPSRLHVYTKPPGVDPALDPDDTISPVLRRSNWQISIPALPDASSGSGSDSDSNSDSSSSSRPGFVSFANMSELASNPKYLALRPGIEGTNGYLDVYYPPVWEAMLPAIRLASRVLQNMHGPHLFYDALFHGRREPVSDDRIPADFDGDDLGEFWPSDTGPTSASICQDWIGFAGETKLSIKCKSEDEGSYATTRYDWLSGSPSRIALTPDIIIPLLSNKLTESERHINTFFLAAVILHELAHAVNFYWEKNYRRAAFASDDFMFLPKGEPYFRDEVAAEVGHSGENALWGGELGVNFPRTRGPDSTLIHNPPYLKIHRHSPFPLRNSYVQGAYSSNPILDNVWGKGTDRWSRSTLRLDFLQDIQTPEFWDVIIAKYGMEMLKDNIPPYRLNCSKEWSDLTTSIPNTLKRVGVKRKAAELEIAEHEASVKLDNDPGWELKNRRMRVNKRIIEDFELHKRGEWRANKRWAKGSKVLHYFSQSFPMGSSLDDIIVEIATSKGMVVPDLMKRSWKYIEDLISEYLISQGIRQDEYFDAEKEMILEGWKGWQTHHGSTVGADLDDIVQNILGQHPTWREEIRQAKAGGDTRIFDNLADLVRQYLETNGFDRDYFDKEMIRQRGDPAGIFYIKPDLMRYRRGVLNQLQAAGLSIDRGFSLAERFRDALQADGYPREALDGEMGAGVTALAIPDLDAAKEEFYASMSEDGDGTTQHILEMWRQWLVSRRYSTNTPLFG